MKKFHIHVIPLLPANGDRGVVYNVEAASAHDAVSKGRAAHREEPQYLRVRGRHWQDWDMGGQGPLQYTPVPA